MFIGVHSLIFTKDAEAARAFFRDVLEFPWVNAGDGWLVFALPPTEVGLHPEDGDRDHELHLLCDDIHATVARLQAKGVKLIEPIHEEEWGIATRSRSPATPGSASTSPSTPS